MDPIPSGYVHLCEALCQAAERLYPNKTALRHSNGAFAGLSPLSGFIDPTWAIDELVHAFRVGDLEAQVYSADANRTFGLMRSDFEAFFPERLFLSPIIKQCGQGDPLARYVGRTPFVNQVTLLNWLASLRPVENGPLAIGLSETQLRIKNDLFDRVGRGEQKPEEAEQEAKNFGCGPLNPEPDTARFDPMQKSRWSVPMAVEWIMSRVADDVREMDNEYLAECRYWQWREYKLPVDGGAGWRIQKGWVLEPAHPVTTNSLQRRLEPVGCEQTLRELWHRLQQGELKAEGVPCAGGARIEIPSLEWVDLEPREEGRAREYFGYRLEPFGRAYTDVLVKRDDILRLWPASTPGSTAPPPGRRPRNEAASFVTADRAHFPAIATMLETGAARSAYGAALQLARVGKLPGDGTPESRAKRVATLYKRERAAQ